MRRTLLAALALAITLPAAAQFAKPEEAVKYRQSAWTVLNQHFSRIGLMTRGRLPFDGRVALRDAELVEALARLPTTAFGPGTDLPNDHARPEIWTEAQRFRELNERMVTATARLTVAARTQDLDQIKAAYGAAANTCKECHDAYRSH
jgi:cytochrome c556